MNNLDHLSAELRRLSGNLEGYDERIELLLSLEDSESLLVALAMADAISNGAIQVNDSGVQLMASAVMRLRDLLAEFEN